jgi:hypothetical protein
MRRDRPVNKTLGRKTEVKGRKGGGRWEGRKGEKGSLIKR